MKSNLLQATFAPLNSLNAFYKRIAVALLALLVLSGGAAWAQTDPAVFSLSAGSYSFTTWAATATAGTYPANMRFHVTGSSSTDPSLATVMSADYVLAYNLTSSARVTGLGANGFSFVNSGSGANYLGAAELGLNTLGRSSIQVSWLGGTVATGGRSYGLRLQYKIGAAGAWTDVPGPVEYVSSATAGNSSAFGPTTLPIGCENQSAVYLRWKYYLISGTGTRPELRVDEISVTSSAAAAAPTVTSSAATSIGTTTANLNGNITSDGGASVTDRGFAYKTSSGVTIADNKTQVGTGTGSFTLSPVLSVNVQYFFKAYGINTAGTTLSTPELNFWTLANTPNAPTVGNPTASTLDVTIDTGDGNPSGTTYAIQEAGSSLYVQSSGGGLSGSADWQTAATWGTKTVTGLTAGTSYSFKVKARNGANTETSFGGTTSGTTAGTPCPTITVSTIPGSLPSGTVAAAYAGATVSAGGSVATPYTYTISAGALPPGLSLNSSSGVISGTPTHSGTYNFTLRATDGNTCFGILASSITVGCPTITVTPSQMPPNGTVSTPYSSTTFSASGANGSYTYAISAGALPAGLTLSSGGVLSGTPAVGGTFNFTVRATDSSTCTGDSSSYSITIACPTITVAPASLPNGTAGAGYGNQTISASGGTGPYTYAVSSGSLPNGLTLTSVGVLSGTPTTSGTFSFTITATDAQACTGSGSYSVTIGCPTVTITTATLPSGSVNKSYSQTIAASASGLSSFTFSVTSGTLPTGLTLAPSTGILSGTPTVPGVYNFTVTATSGGCSGNKAYTVQIILGSSSLVIAEIYGGGGNSGAPYNRDYVVLFNRSCSAQSINGWSIQYASATGTSWSKLDLPNATISAGSYYLIRMTLTGTTGNNLPTPDATVTTAIDMSGTAGKVALCNTTTALTGNPASLGSTVVDFVGFGTSANQREGTTTSDNAPAPSNTTSAQRNGGGCTDTDNNAADFASGAPNPRNSSTAASLCGPVATVSGNTTICSGGSATITVTLSGQGPWTYTWTDGTTPTTRTAVGGSGQTGTDTFSVNPTVTTTYSVTTVTDSGVCSNPGTTAGSATVTLTGSPQVTADPQDLATCKDSTASFTVTASGALTYQWRKGGTPIANGLTGNGSTYSGATTATLLITGVQPADAVASASGFDCVITGTCTPDATSAKAGLTVNAVVVSAPSGSSICEGASTSMSVSASGGTPTYTYQWKKDGVAISGATSSSYSIATAALTDVGLYTCTVTDSGGCITTSASATIQVNLFGKTSLLAENFGSGVIPNAWTLSGAATWSGSASSASSGYFGASGSGNATITDSATTDASLITPAVSLSGLSRGILTFAFRGTATWLRDLFVEVSVDNGASYSTVQQYTIAANPTLKDTFWHYQSLELGAGVNNQSQVKVRWRIAGTGSGPGNLRIDDIQIFGLQAPTISPSAPAVCPGSSVVLAASAGVSWLWTPSTGLSSATVQNPTATPSATTLYSVLVTDANGCSASGSATVTVNPVPTAPSTISSNIAPTLSLKVDIASLLASWQGTGLSLQSVGANSAQGGTVFSDATYIYYLPPSETISSDSFSYTVVNSSGCSTPATLNLVVTAPPGTQTINLTINNNTPTIRFFGVLGVQYDIQRATDVNGTWTTINTTPLTPAADGSVTYVDTGAPNGQAFYRTIQH